MREFGDLEVTVFHNDVEQAMRVLKKKLQNDGLFRQLKAKRSYEKHIASLLSKLLMGA